MSASTTASSSSIMASTSSCQQSTAAVTTGVRLNLKSQKKEPSSPVITSEQAMKSVKQIIKTAVELSQQKPNENSRWQRDFHRGALTSAAEDLSSMKRRDLSLIEMQYELIRQNTQSTATIQSTNQYMAFQNDVRRAEKLVKEALGKTEPKRS